MNKTLKVRDLIYRAFKTSKVTSMYEELDDTEISEGFELLNSVISEFNYNKLFFIVNKKIELQADGSDYYIVRGISTQTIDSVYFTNDQHHRKLKKLSFEEFESLKYNNSSEPMGYFFVFDNEDSTINLVSKNIIGKVEIRTTGKLEHFETLDDEVSVDEFWYLCLEYSLAVRICNNFSAPIPEFVVAKSNEIQNRIENMMREKENEHISFVAYPGCIPSIY